MRCSPERIGPSVFRHILFQSFYFSKHPFICKLTGIQFILCEINSAIGEHFIIQGRHQRITYFPVFFIRIIRFVHNGTDGCFQCIRTECHAVETIIYIIRSTLRCIHHLCIHISLKRPHRITQIPEHKKEEQERCHHKIVHHTSGVYISVLPYFQFYYSLTFIIAGSHCASPSVFFPCTF